MRIIPIFQREAFEYVSRFHRHHSKPRGSIFQIAAAIDDKIVGVAIIGRPTGRGNQDGLTLEVIRLFTDGTKNACSFLYAASWRAARELGYRKLITYILNTEPGTSLKASGWHLVGERGGGSWNTPSRPRIDMHPTQVKLMFEIEAKT